MAVRREACVIRTKQEPVTGVEESSLERLGQVRKSSVLAFNPYIAWVNFCYSLKKWPQTYIRKEPVYFISFPFLIPFRQNKCACSFTR